MRMVSMIQKTKWMGETTNELNPCKDLTRLLTLVEVMRKGEENR